MTRNKGDKDYTQREKHLLISLINDYSLFGARDHEVIQMLSKKIGKNVSETLFYRLKKEVKAKIKNLKNSLITMQSINLDFLEKQHSSNNSSQKKLQFLKNLIRELQ